MERAPGATFTVRVVAAQAVTSRTGRACAVAAPAIPVEPSPGPWGACPEPLADGFGRRITDLRVSVTDRCNLRCRYCMPEEGVRLLDHNRVLRSEEIIRVVKVAVGLGVRKVPMRGCNDDEVPSMARWAAANGLHLRYIEFMPFAGNGWSPDRVVSAAEIRATLSRELRLGAGRRETAQSPAVTYPIRAAPCPSASLPP